jgi:hypothetical protein
LHSKHWGKLSTIIDQIAHGHHVFRAYFRNAVLRQYEKLSMLLRNGLCSNNLYDFGLRKGLEHLDEVRHKFQAIISRFAAFQAQWLNVHVDFPLLQRIGLPITIGSVRYPGIKIQDARPLEVLLHGHPGRRLDREGNPPRRPDDSRPYVLVTGKVDNDRVLRSKATIDECKYRISSIPNPGHGPIVPPTTSPI